MTDGGESPDEPTDTSERSRRGPDEPLGDVAEKVRERTGEPRASGEDPPRREGPLADVASTVDERRRRRDRDADDPFESVDVGELDGEKLWEQLAEGDDAATVAVPSEATVEGEADGATDDAAVESGRNVRTIPKDTCHGCPHFGDPPELRCTNEGTDILAMTDADHFRVADCPMVVDGEEDIGSIADGDVDGGANGQTGE
jgi:hypothetical protein